MKKFLIISSFLALLPLASCANSSQQRAVSYNAANATSGAISTIVSGTMSIATQQALAR